MPPQESAENRSRVRELFEQEPVECLSSSVVAKNVNIERPEAERVLQSLLEEGIVQENTDGYYRVQANTSD